MTLKIYDAFSRLSILDINRVTNFLFEHSGTFKAPKNTIRKSLLYAAKELPGLGGYVFVVENKFEILGAAVINRTGMRDYLSENILVYLAVKENVRGKGIANKLIDQVKSYCKGDIALHLEKDSPVIELFEKKGFKSKNIEMRLKRNK